MSWFGALEDAEGSWLGFDIWILIWIWSLVFGGPVFWILALYLDFEFAKNIHVLKILIWEFGGHWRFLTGVWNLDLDLDMVPGLWYTHVSSFGSLSWFWRCREQPCLLHTDLGLQRMLEAPDWGLGFLSWYQHSLWSLGDICSKLALYLDLEGAKNIQVLKVLNEALENARGSWLGFNNLIFIFIWSLVFGTPIFQILALYFDFKGAKNIHVLKFLIWGFGGCYRLPTGVWDLEFDLNIVTGLW